MLSYAKQTVTDHVTVFLFVPQVLNKENMSWPHNFIQSYVTHKTGKKLSTCF